jgi:beta-N-acetylhexosaminidase
MTLEEKVGQLLMVHFHGETANAEAQILIQETKVGGIIYYNWSNGLYSQTQVATLSAGLQKLTENNRIPLPLLIAADQEGGIVSRLRQGFTEFPGNKALGMTGDPALAEAAAFAMGQELYSVGINMNLAPVVDINTNPQNPVIGLRSFGEDPETVIAFGEQALNGYKRAHIISTLKHFPGYGDVSVDPHSALPLVNKSKAELESTELLPFAQLAASADAIMTAHILVPALDEENCATLSEKTLTYLRETLGFQGVIVADSLVMEGVLTKCGTVDEASIAALNAGCDLLILGGKLLIGEHSGFELTTPAVQRIHNSLVQAVKEGRIQEARLDQAVEKILTLKKRYTQIDPCALAQKIASLALRTIQGDLTALHEKNLCIIAPQLLRTNIEKTTLLHKGKSYFFESLNPSSLDIEAALQQTQTAEAIILCSYNAWKNPSQAALIHALIDTGKPVCLLVTRDPLDATLFPKATCIINTFSPTTPSIQAVCDQLK